MGDSEELQRSENGAIELAPGDSMRGAGLNGTVTIQLLDKNRRPIGEPWDEPMIDGAIDLRVPVGELPPGVWMTYDVQIREIDDEVK